MVTLTRAGSDPVGRGRWRGWAGWSGQAIAWVDPIDRLFALLTQSRANEDPHDASPAPRGLAAPGADLGAKPRADAYAARPPATPGQSDFDAFFAHYQQPLYGYLRRLVPTDDAATDLAQEAFVRAWRHFAEVRAYDRPAAWLFRVATNLAISHLRRRMPLSLSQTVRMLHHDPAASNPPADDELLVDPGDFASASAERDLINALLARLPERQRAALLLRAVHGFTCDEIAETLEISSVAARKTLSRGRERFRALYVAAQREGGWT